MPNTNSSYRKFQFLVSHRKNKSFHRPAKKVSSDISSSAPPQLSLPNRNAFFILNVDDKKTQGSSDNLDFKGNERLFESKSILEPLHPQEVKHASSLYVPKITSFLFQVGTFFSLIQRVIAQGSGGCGLQRVTQYFSAPVENGIGHYALSEYCETAGWVKNGLCNITLEAKGTIGEKFFTFCNGDELYAGTNTTANMTAALDCLDSYSRGDSSPICLSDSQKKLLIIILSAVGGSLCLLGFGCYLYHRKSASNTREYQTREDRDKSIQNSFEKIFPQELVDIVTEYDGGPKRRYQVKQGYGRFFKVKNQDENEDVSSVPLSDVKLSRN